VSNLPRGQTRTRADVIAAGMQYAHPEAIDLKAEEIVQYLLVLLVVITMACGAAASVTISHAPAYAGDSGKGY
jgi:hypothetical protein